MKYGQKCLAKKMSQSPLVGAFVPALYEIIPHWPTKKSQSPLVGAFVPAMIGLAIGLMAFKSQSPLVGAFVPARMDELMAYAVKKVAIPSGRGIRSG